MGARAWVGLLQKGDAGWECGSAGWGAGIVGRGKACLAEGNQAGELALAVEGGQGT